MSSSFAAHAALSALFVAAASASGSLLEEEVGRPFGSDPLAPELPEGSGGEADPSNPSNPSNPSDPGQPPAWAYQELLVNGDFGTGDLFAWTFVGPPAWQVSLGEVGLHPFGPGESNPFANALSSGRHPVGTTVDLWQTAMLPEGIDEELLFSFAALTAFDALHVRAEWLDLAAAEPALVRSDDLGSFGRQQSAVRDDVALVLVRPAEATHVTFRATGELADGTWIDAGLDDASILAAVPVPEPAAAGVLAIASLVALRRRSAS